MNYYLVALAVPLAAASYSVLKLANNPYLKYKGPDNKHWPMNKITKRMLSEGKNVHKVLNDAADEYGGIVYFRVFTNHFLLVSDNNTIKHILKNRDIFENPEALRESINYPFGGRSAFASEGEVWKRKHHVLQPMLKLPVLKKSTNVAFKHMNHLMNLFKQYGNGKESFSVETFSLFRRVIVDIVGEIIFGTEFNSLPRSAENDSELYFENQIIKHFKLIFEELAVRNQLPKFLWALRYAQSGEKEASDYVKKEFLRLIEMKKEDRGLECEDPTDVISLILKFKENSPEEGDELYPEIDILTECLALFGASQDTTTTTMALIAYHLMNHPEMQEKIRDEYEQVFGSKLESCESLDYEELQKLKFLSNFVRESQRLLPTVSMLVRNVVSDYEYEGVTFRKGTVVLLNTYYTQISEQFYEKPNEFIPERWDNLSQNEKPFYLFGSGARPCLGQKLANIEIRVLTLMLVKNFKITPDPSRKAEIEYHLGLTPKNRQCWVQLSSRS